MLHVYISLQRLSFELVELIFITTILDYQH